MRKNRKAPLVALPRGAKCCEGILQLGADQLPLHQPTIVGTPAWNAAYHGRRNQVETVNGFLHGGFTDIGKKYVHFWNTARIRTMLAHTIAGLHRWIVNRWKRANRLLAPDDPAALPPERKKRKPGRGRLHRFEDLLERPGARPRSTRSEQLRIHQNV